MVRDVGRDFFVQVPAWEIPSGNSRSAVRPAANQGRRLAGRQQRLGFDLLPLRGTHDANFARGPPAGEAVTFIPGKQPLLEAGRYLEKTQQ